MKSFSLSRGIVLTGIICFVLNLNVSCCIHYYHRGLIILAQDFVIVKNASHNILVSLKIWKTITFLKSSSNYIRKLTKLKVGNTFID